MACISETSPSTDPCENTDLIDCRITLSLQNSAYNRPQSLMAVLSLARLATGLDRLILSLNSLATFVEKLSAGTDRPIHGLEFFG